MSDLIVEDGRARVRANMDVVLEAAFRRWPHGGDYESRKFVAQRMLECAASGRETLSELTAAAHRALLELSNRRRH